jgi:3-oxoacyl-ACP reductase-like protein
MIATLAFFALTQPSPPAAAAAAPTAQTAAPIAAPVAAPVAAQAASNAKDDYDRVAQIYAQTCDDRAYGSYDDLCDQLQKQLRQYRIELDRQAREAASNPEKAPSAPRP